MFDSGYQKSLKQLFLLHLNNLPIYLNQYPEHKNEYIAEFQNRNLYKINNFRIYFINNKFFFENFLYLINKNISKF